MVLAGRRVIAEVGAARRGEWLISATDKPLIFNGLWVMQMHHRFAFVFQWLMGGENPPHAFSLKYQALVAPKMVDLTLLAHSSFNGFAVWRSTLATCGRQAALMVMGAKEQAGQAIAHRVPVAAGNLDKAHSF